MYFVEIVYIILYVSGVWLRLWDGVILFYVNVDLMLRGFIDIFSEKFVVIISLFVMFLVGGSNFFVMFDCWCYGEYFFIDII